MSPKTIEDHVRQMKNNYVWGELVEIFAASLYFQKPACVCGTHKSKSLDSEYYWAKYFCQAKSSDLTYPATESKVVINNNLQHFEICHINFSHCEAITMMQDNSLPCISPYKGNSSTSIISH